MSAIQIATYILSRNAAVKAIATAAKVFPIDAPQNTVAPYITVNLVSGQDEHLLDGAGKYYQHRVTVESIGRSPAEALNLGDAALAAVENTIKQHVDTFVDVDIHFADVDFTQPNDSRTAYQRVQQFYIRWRRA